jgi:HK97 family phage portal protein
MATRLDLLRKNIISKNSIDAYFLRNKLGGQIGDSDDVMVEPYKKSDLCYICISTTARAISQVPIYTAKIINNQSGDKKPLPLTDQWQLLWNRPNYIIDRYTFIEAIVTHLFLDGQVFVIPFPPGLEVPLSMWIAPKKYMKPVVDKMTGNLLGWYYNSKGFSGNEVPIGSILLDYSEVSNIYFFNPYNPFEGLSPLEAGRKNIIVDYKAGVYTETFFENGAVPGGILYTEQKLGNTQFTRTKEQFQSEHVGYKRGHRLAVLEQGLKYVQTGLTQKDMQFGDLRKMASERIYQIFGMKKSIISVVEKVNYATAREERKEWWEGTNIPILKMMTSALSFTLHPKRELVEDFDTGQVAALKEALKDKVETGYKLWQMGFTADEVNRRLDFGFDNKPWRTTWYMPVNLVPVEEVGKIQESAPKALLSGVESEIKVLDKDESRNIAIWEGFIHQVSPLESQFQSKISRIFFEMRKKSLELLFRQKKTPKDLEEDLFEEARKNIIDYTDPLYKNAIMLGVTTLIEEIGSSIAFGWSDPEAISFLATKQLKIVGVIQTIKNQIQKELVESYQIGESIDKIADRIRNVFDVAKSRALVIARTEIIGAANEGRAIAINRSGFKEKEWFTALDEKVRDQHKAMHGKKIKVGTFWVFSDGTSLRHPGDYSGPAHQIIQCRCVEIVIPGTHYLN